MRDLHPKAILESLSPRERRERRDTCIVFMDFHSSMTPVFDALERALAGAEPPIELVRVDRAKRRSRGFIREVLRGILRAEFVLVDISAAAERGHAFNENTLYELGLAHALKDDVIYLLRSGQTPPSNLRHLTYVPYEPDALDDLAERVVDELEELRAAKRLGDVSHELSSLARRCAYRVSDWVRYHLEVLESIAAWPELSTNDANEHARVLPRADRSLRAFQGGVYTLDEQGIVLAAYHPSEPTRAEIVGAPRGNRKYFREYLASQRALLSDSVESSEGEHRILVALAPRHAADGTALGILDTVIDIREAEFSGLLEEEIARAGIDFDVTVHLVDESRWLLGSSDRDAADSMLADRVALRLLDHTEDTLVEEDRDRTAVRCRVPDTSYTVVCHAHG